MKRCSILIISTVVAFGLVSSLGGTAAQQKSLKEQIVGTWLLVSADIVQPNGIRSPTFGPNPKGIAVFDSSGHYVVAFNNSSVPKFATNSRTSGTADENKAVVQGSITHFGTYTINETDRSYTLRIASSSFPNWNETEQKRPFTIMGDELKWVTPAISAGGGTGEVVMKRAK